jgi:uncharacterized Zn-finger protein
MYFHLAAAAQKLSQNQTPALNNLTKRKQSINADAKSVLSVKTARLCSGENGESRSHPRIFHTSMDLLCNVKLDDIYNLMKHIIDFAKNDYHLILLREKIGEN